MTVRVLGGHVVEVLDGLPAQSVHVTVCSPPYWSLRSYNTVPQVWPDPDGQAPCAEGEHEWDEYRVYREGGGAAASSAEAFSVPGQANADRIKAARWTSGAVCTRCGSWRGELGSEPTVERYIANLVSVFRAVRRVLRDDGTCWVNLGASYFNDAGGQNGTSGNVSAKAIAANTGAGRQDRTGRVPRGYWLKPLDYVDVPGLFAHAMQQPYSEHCIKREVDRAWMAALVDGEGTIGIGKKVHRKVVRKDGAFGGVQYVPYLQVANSDVALLERCIAITGYGTLNVKHPVGDDARGIRNRFVGYGWRLDSDKALEVIRDIFPFLIAKRRQAILANTLDRSNKETGALGPHKPVPAAVWEQRELLKTLMHACNQREDGIVLPDWCREPEPVTIHPGWLWRADMALVKRSPMPESVSGTFWTRCRVKVAASERAPETVYAGVAHGTAQSAPRGPASDFSVPPPSIWQDCPGCARCAPNQGLVLRRGNGRPTRSWERLLVFAKRPNYFWDSESVREPLAAATVERERQGYRHAFATQFNGSPTDKRYLDGKVLERVSPAAGRNLRDWLFWEHSALKEPHYAAFGPFIPRLAIKAGTSERGCCPTCLAPWARVIDRERRLEDGRTQWGCGPKTTGIGPVEGISTLHHTIDTTTTGWRPTCPRNCPGHDQPPIAATVLDCFGGSGTTGLAADRLGRDCILVDLNPDYTSMAVRRLLADAPLLAEVHHEPSSNGTVAHQQAALPLLEPNAADAE